MNGSPILAFDCATAVSSVALRAGTITEALTLGHNRQAAELVAAIDGLMKKYGLDYGDLGCMVSTVGPGSFTGVRIGLAALHGFVLAGRVPIKTVSTLEALAWEVSRNPHAPERFATALRAGKGEAYGQRYRLAGGNPVAEGEIDLCPEAQARADGTYGNLQAEDSPYYLGAPNAAVLCEVADFLAPSTLAEAMPLYIRPPDAAIPAPPAWLK